ncbi:hypothetical protein BHE74_00028871 [Ensete ventricosum]|uniref:Uncharacterized protein n=1 Tax=Ensete ventricosum TaxID=4639 RepID=A0A426ZRL6_ENSVE|nr:hypothetical protein B296_00040093 [Ensete ventricosum]RWV95440.1 hypothetical protein GW17_00041930 [Ensete ventricosum]RWW63928.1 hypothetical protein BHE74_00028871 [Ensete ventricosum]RZR93204.1 hypothetical protein BHM03_00021643 [Ensete ventricosum]
MSNDSRFLIHVATQPNIAVGSEVWVEDPDVAWIDGEVLDVKRDEITIRCSSGKTVGTLINPLLTISYLHCR